MSQTANTYDIKSANLDVLAFVLRSDNIDELTQALESRFGNRAKPSAAEAVVLDLAALDNPAELALERLLPLLGRFGFRAVALRHPDPAYEELAHRFGLAHVTGQVVSARTPASEAPAPAPEAPASVSTMIVDRPVRAGQQIYAKGGDLVVLAMVSAGAEVIADGNIHVYAPLRGRALAGARGNTAARIFTQCMEAELVSIAGVYRTIEQALPDSIRGKPAQVFLENERLVINALGE
ncbi:septum site-determining protein MinC [Pseudogulbenkiania sp. MAI-1]|uniref:septum site-determining protein MinC n=1 Tax=Pseudogulbenkiania sp. MAI-1 TaxID=990370 RepID=UPI00045EC195|nr:septum site-determining protein MinC [Pseudogulbenkiania sp. MAI-1]